jgi:CPA1 family monovalent cation:H+ antiporter
MIEPLALLAFFMLTIISAFVYFASKKFKIPYTILLVLVGLLIVPIAQLPIFNGALNFIKDTELTPELLFFVFLPILIFESAYNINIRRMVDSSWVVISLSVIGLALSTIFIALGLYFLLPFVGIQIPLIIALLFGAIISSTDPVAVLALFKEYGAPKRLSLIFEGESLFNDGTAVALFLVFLAIAESGFNGSSTIIEGLLLFVSMVGFGVIFGLLMAIVFSRFLRFTRSSEFVAITLLLVSAHVVFISAELINEHGLLGLPIHISPIIATTVTALFLGNYSKHILSPKSDSYTEKLISHMAFVANSLVFLLAGILFASANIPLNVLLIPIIVTILIVATARALSVYGVLIPLKILNKDNMPSSWQKLLAWGSLRGALAIIVVQLIPSDLVVSNWPYSYSVKEFVLALTIGCVLATLFIKGLSIGPLMKKLKIDGATNIDIIMHNYLGLYYLLTQQHRFNEQKIRGYIKDQEYQQLSKHLQSRIDNLVIIQADLKKELGLKPFEQALRLIAVNIEEKYLKELYVHQEISEQVYRQIYRKLQLQKEKIENAQDDTIDPTASIDYKDIFDRLVLFITGFLADKNDTKHEQKTQYYRAQLIISRKALKVLHIIHTEHKIAVFDQKAYEIITNIYDNYRHISANKLENLLKNHEHDLKGYVAELSFKSLDASGYKALSFYQDKGVANEETQELIHQLFSLNSINDINLN